MTVMNFDLEDGSPKVSFTLKPDDAERFARFMAECFSILAQEKCALDAPKTYQHLFRFRFEQAGGHTHVRVFAGKGGSMSLGLCGTLVMRNEEWAEFSKWCDHAGPVEIVEEEPHAAQG